MIDSIPLPVAFFCCSFAQFQSGKSVINGRCGPCTSVGPNGINARLHFGCNSLIFVDVIFVKIIQCHTLSPHFMILFCSGIYSFDIPLYRYIGIMVYYFIVIIMSINITANKLYMFFVQYNDEFPKHFNHVETLCHFVYNKHSMYN